MQLQATRNEHKMNIIIIIVAILATSATNSKEAKRKKNKIQPVALLQSHKND